jgi:hypothetical protein
MKATDLLTKQHQEVSRLFDAIKGAKNDLDKKAFFLELASKLCAHDAIERQIFYPACEEVMGLNDELGEALVEHGVIEFSIYQAHEALGKPDFDFKCTVLKEMVEHHVEEEQDDFFPHAQRALGQDTLEVLGEEMEEAFEEACAEDFRAPLHENLRQVFAGTLQPTPKAKQKPKNRASA